MKMKMNDKPLTTGRLIEAIMKYRGMNYAQMAEAVGEHPINFCKVLNGNRNVFPEMAIKVARVLNMSPLVIMTSRNIEIVNNNE
jgi:plasmid maintenance system antidote protein VapI